METNGQTENEKPADSFKSYGTFGYEVGLRTLRDEKDDPSQRRSQSHIVLSFLLALIVVSSLTAFAVALVLLL